MHNIPRTTHSPCRLCRALEPSEEPAIENTILFQSKRFVVLPALGPLSLGHVHVVSREHFPNLGSMGPDAIAEYEQIAEHLRHRPLFSKGFVEAEHGATDEASKGGACVIHTHVHWIPGFHECYSEIIANCDNVAELSSLADLARIVGPYIFVRTLTDPIAVFDARGLPSQFLRGRLCACHDRDDRDWKQALRPDLVEATVSQWQGS